MDKLDGKLRSRGIAIGVAVFALALVDLIALRGESVGGGTLSLNADATPMLLAITRPNEEHLVEIGTRKRVGGEDTGRSISYQLVDPDGVTVAEESELISRKKRFFSFRPTQAGEYRLRAEETGLLFGSSSGSASVAVTVGDRRTLSRWLGF